ncbi:putative DNA binding domain-containing protein [Saprospiraceae bacterium]|nr:putative DNA binding domain-containing protein [Saprospiraceae bacterium]
MTRQEMAQTITNHEVFAGLNETDLSQLSSIVSYISVKTGEVVFEIDDTPEHLYYLIEGSLTLSFPDNTKLELLPGELIGEIGILNGDFRLGRLVANTDSSLIIVSAKELLDASIIPPCMSLEIMKRLSKRVTNYLRSIQQTSTKELIIEGENDHTEFKSTLRWNIKANKKDPRITYAILKTLAAFLNSEGGTLIVGVADDGEILGLDEDRFETEDKLLLFVTNVIKDNLGTLNIENIHFQTENISGKLILRIAVLPSTTPCYVSDDKLDHFYIRTGPSTTDLRLSKVYEFIKNRFHL